MTEKRDQGNYVITSNKMSTGNMVKGTANACHIPECQELTSYQTDSKSLYQGIQRVSHDTTTRHLLCMVHAWYMVKPSATPVISGMGVGHPCVIMWSELQHDRQ